MLILIYQTRRCKRKFEVIDFHLCNVTEGQLAQYNYILVVGEKEKSDRTVNIRTRFNLFLVHLLKYIGTMLFMVRER